MGFYKQEYWSWLLFLTPADPPDQEIEPSSPLTHALAGGFFTTEPPGKPGFISTGALKSVAI